MKCISVLDIIFTGFLCILNRDITMIFELDKRKIPDAAILAAGFKDMNQFPEAKKAA